MGITTTSSIAEFRKRLMARAQDIKNRVASLRGKSVKVGIPAGATYPNGKSVAEVAELVSYGIRDDGSPSKKGPRRFMFVASERNKDKWKNMLRKRVSSTIQGKSNETMRQIMKDIGSEIQKDIQDTMDEMGLSDTGTMHDSISILEINGERMKN